MGVSILAKRWKAIVIGGGGSQAQAMLRAIARSGSANGWLAVDRAWTSEARLATERLGIEVADMDPLSSEAKLVEFLGSTRLVANLAGPYYRTGLAILDAAIKAGTDYIDICDDADVVIPMLDRDAAARKAGIAALLGMGSSPGTTNVLIRAAVDALGTVDDVDICWMVDTGDMTEAATRHFWHCFNMVDADGSVHPVKGWEHLERKFVEFPPPVGRQMVVRLSHPEPITVPRFLPVKRASNFGGIAPEEALVTSWTLAHITDQQRSGGDLTDMAATLFRRYRERLAGAPRIGSGMMIDVHTNGDGLRFAAGNSGAMDDATGVPAAAGALLMLEGAVTQKGVLSPELVQPSAFFETLRRVSEGGGGLGLYRLKGGRVCERLRIRDLIAGKIDAGSENMQEAR